MSAGLLAVLAAQIDARRDDPAIDDRGQITTYGQLWAWAGAIAIELDQRGVGRGDRVTLELGYSAGVVAAMLGCWWIGAAFIPMPPELPRERARVILAEAQPKLRLDASVVDRLRGLSVDLRPPVAIEPEQLAYILYTSGSAGRPKGVMVPHRGIAALLAAQCEAFAIHRHTRSLAVLSLAFDAAISDIGTVLYAGATLVIVDRSQIRDPAGLLDCIAQHRISYADLPPALLGHLDPDRLPQCLTTIVIGGEVCPADVVRRFATRVRLIVVYGPTETSVCASWIRCDPTWERAQIGQPLPGWEFHVVDGELWIGGIGVALGYVDASLDADRFVERDGQRVFRTGDRVVVSADGSITFVGRLDRQRKIAGVRIELDEIEAWLVEHPRVVEAAIVEAEPGVLIAAFVTRDLAVLELAELREHLSDRLPAPAIPRRFVQLDSLPRGTAGKLDRHRLVTDLQTIPTTSTGEQPDDIEAVLEPVWRRLLGLDSVDRHARFADLGGHSLTALELVAAGQPLGITLSAAFVLGNPSFAELLAAARAAVTDVRTTALLRADVAAAIDRDSLDRTPLATRPTKLSSDATLLITGATGFVGRRLLARIRERHQGRIVCLVRDPSKLPSDVEPVIGNLAAPELGLSPATWAALADQTDAIIHAGARVHLGLGFAALAPVNLDGTARVVRLAIQGRPKQLHYISTLSVFVAATPAISQPDEDCDLAGTSEVHGGYAQSKWAAEQLVRQCARSLPTAIYRLGLITGDVIDGRGPDHDQLGLVIRGLVELGAIPAGHEPLRFDVTPVCYTAAGLAELILAGPPHCAGPEPSVGTPTTWQLASPHGATAADLLAAIRRSGARVDVVDPDAWAQLGRSLSSRSSAAAVAYLALGRCLDRPSFARLRAYDLFQSTGFTFGCARATAWLAPLGIVCPPADPSLLDRYVHAARTRNPEAHA